MIAEALKKALLQAAIQGKLTEQLPEDGDARDLIKQIQKEKTRLINEGKIKKEKLLPEIKHNEHPFDIPENWVWVRLHDISSILGDGLHGTPQYHANGDFYFINGNNLINGKIEIKNDTKRVNFDEYTKYQKPLGEKTILVSINGTLGNVAFYNDEKIILGKSACYFNLLGQISKEYVKIILNSHYFLDYAINIATGSTIKNVSLAAMRMFLIPLPPFSEQERVVKLVDELLPEFYSLKLEENKLNNLEKAFPGKIRASILQSAIQGKLTEQLPEDGDARDLLKEIQKEKIRLVKEGKIKKEKTLPEITEDEIPFDIPENWVWCRLSELVWLGNGDKKTGIKLPYLEAKVLRGQKKSFFETSGEVVYAGERIILVDGENSGEVFEVPFDGYLGSTFKKLVFASTSAVPFILIFLKKYQYLFKNNKTGSAIPHLNKTLFRELLTPLAPLAEQKRIVEQLEQLLPLCERLE